MLDQPQKFKKIAFLFPGQGVQTPKMGKDFIDNFAVAKTVFNEGDDLLNYSLSSIILNGTLEELTQTHHSQSAIYLTSIAMLRVVQSLYPIQPFVCAGLSLGEYTALTAANWLPFDQTCRLVQKRGQFMSEACEKTEGKMAVVMGLEAAIIEKCIQEVNLPHDLWIANFNCPGQIVLSGTAVGIEKGTESVKAAGAKRVIPLQVHGAFHSGLMQYAEDKMAPYIQACQLTPSLTQLVMNVPGDFVADPNQAKKDLISQLTHSVKWEQGIRAMEREVDLFIAFGPEETLKGMNTRIGVKVPTISISQVAHLEKLQLLEREGKLE